MTGVDTARAAAETGAWQDVLAALDNAGEHSGEAVELRATALYATGDLEGCLAHGSGCTRVWRHRAIVKVRLAPRR